MKMINDMTFLLNWKEIFLKSKKKIKEGNNLCRLQKSVATFSFCCPNNNRISE